MKTEIWAGTFREKPAAPWAAECLKNDTFREAVAGLGIQYHNTMSIEALATAYPGLRFMYTEATCCGGKNTASEAQGHFREMTGAFLTECDAFAYWNMLLDENQKSGWGWHQNSLFTLDRRNGGVRYNADYQPLYLVSRVVRPGDIRVDANWSGDATGASRHRWPHFSNPTAPSRRCFRIREAIRCP
jgi:glucosylceramidase